MPIEETEEQLMRVNVFRDSVPIWPLQAGRAPLSSPNSEAMSANTKHFSLLEKLSHFPPHHNH